MRLRLSPGLRKSAEKLKLNRYCAPVFAFMAQPSIAANISKDNPATLRNDSLRGRILTLLKHCVGGNLARGNRKEENPTKFYE